MLKSCVRCHKKYATAIPRQKRCYACRAQDMYLRLSKRFTDEEVIADLAAKGAKGQAADKYDTRYDIAFLTPFHKTLYLIRHMSKGRKGRVHLVVRGDKSGNIQYIPTCYSGCAGCVKCKMAAELNSESPEQSRARKADPRSRWHRKTYIRTSEHSIKLKNGLEKACEVPTHHVYSQLEDID